jgi:hypothetical protein
MANMKVYGLAESELSSVIVLYSTDYNLKKNAKMITKIRGLHYLKMKEIFQYFDSFMLIVTKELKYINAIYNIL